MDKRYWPFPIIKPEAEWSEFDQDYIDFMRTAFAKGYRPREGFCSSVEVGAWEDGRSACLVCRGGRNGWEPFLGPTRPGLAPDRGLALVGQLARTDGSRPDSPWKFAGTKADRTAALWPLNDQLCSSHGNDFFLRPSA
jgi:hypothetical protein